MSADVRNLLGRSWIFAELSPPELDHLTSLARVRSFRAKQLVVRKGEDGGHIFAVLRGRLKVITPGIAHDTAFNIMGPGELFGEIAALDGMTRSATVTALEVCQVAAIDHGQFHEFLDRHPAVSRKLLNVLARRVRALTERVEDRAVLDLSARLAKCLLGLADRYGRVDGGAVKIALRLSQQELGELADGTRESVNKLLRTWKTMGVVEHEADSILLLRPADLAELVRDRR